MAIDLLILCLLVVSFVVNLLALGAFWITPGLRTTANRFTINLLVVNLVGCLILAPTLFLCNSDHIDDGETTDADADADAPLSAPPASRLQNDTIEYIAEPGNHQLTIRQNGVLVEQEGIIWHYDNNNNNNNNNNHKSRHHHSTESTRSDGENTIEIFKRNASFQQDLTIGERRDGSIVYTAYEEDVIEPQPTSAAATATSAAAAAAAAALNEFDAELAAASARHRKSLPPLFLPLGGGTRCWSIDLVAALGALAVLLVVGDTWCAVTDPLRYHTRISGMRTWIFIALIWAVGIFFGALSALRELDLETGALLSKKRRFLSSQTHAYFGPIAANGIFGMVFACLYFVVIILLPFGFVCGMYWRIFSEARENGLRMRQNGSSPLLQSALNLTHHQQHQQSTGSVAAPLQYANSLCVHRNSISSTSSHGGGGVGCGGLQMQIDTRVKSASPAHLRRDSAAKVLLPTISDDGGSEEASTPGANDPQPLQDNYVQQDQDHEGEQEQEPQQQQQQHHLDVMGDRNILLTLQAASGEIKRNYSARQLPLLGTSSQDLCDAGRLPGMRQVHSSPNLQRYTQSLDDSDSLSDDAACSPHLLGHHQHAASAHARRFHQLQHNHQHHRSLPQGSSAHQLQHAVAPAHQALQIPAISASPKALSYMSSLRHRLSNASSLFKYREESRAARISILVVIMFLVSYLPYGFLVLLQSRDGVATQFPHSTQLAIFMILLGTLSSPVIFAYRNKRVRRGVKRFIGRDVARCREHSSGGCGGGGGGCGGSLQRQGSSSVKQHNGGAGGNIRRNGSKLSTYSSNSCKYLTPQSSLVGNGTASLHTLALRPHHTIINFCTLPPKHGLDGVDVEADGSDEPATALEGNDSLPPSRPRPILQRGITIVEQIPIGGGGVGGHQSQHHNNNNNNHINSGSPNGQQKFNARHSLFKMFFQSSKNLSCAAAQACSHGAMRHHEPTEV